MNALFVVTIVVVGEGVDDSSSGDGGSDAVDGSELDDGAGNLRSFFSKVLRTDTKTGVWHLLYSFYKSKSSTLGFFFIFFFFL